ncbi:hypothetical protein K523DRAFT_276125 [Schizophyllum commune Tattone D]|nr:hypothetical protein K523DRAFT_276125 [Schizophyllum commune Tattone D]
MPISITPVQAADTAIALTTIGMAVTVFRLGIRIRDKKLGWDDFWAAMSLVSAAILLTGACIILTPKPWMGRMTMITGYYFSGHGFYGTIWCARFSILGTIMRICPSWWMKYFRLMAVAFAGMWIFLFIQYMVHCESDPTWKDTTHQCSLGRRVAAAQLVTDIVADVALSIGPVAMLWQAKLPRGQRMRLITVFASCILTSLVSLAHAYCIWVNKGLDEFFSAMFETSVSMVVASLSVIMGFFYRLRGGDDSGGNIHTSGGTAASNFELASAGRRPINVDISTTVWVEDEAGRDQVKGAPNRSVEDGLGLDDYSKKGHDQVYNGFAR